MKIRSLFLTVLLLSSASIIVAQSESKALDPVAMVKNLYAAHDTGSGPFSQTKDRALVERYFVKELAGLIWKDSVATKGGSLGLGADPLYDSQDPQITKLRVGETKFEGNNKAVVDVTFKDWGKAKRIGFQFEQDKSKAWKIANVHYSTGYSLKEALRSLYAGR